MKYKDSTAAPRICVDCLSTSVFQGFLRPPSKAWHSSPRSFCIITSVGLAQNLKHMKKYLFILVTVLVSAISAYAYERGTCKIANGSGASVVAEVSGGGHNVVYLNFYNDASTSVNMTVKVKVSNGASFNPAYATGEQTFLVKPGTSNGSVKIDNVSWHIDPKNVTQVIVTGARCE